MSEQINILELNPRFYRAAFKSSSSVTSFRILKILEGFVEDECKRTGLSKAAIYNNSLVNRYRDEFDKRERIGVDGGSDVIKDNQKNSS